MASISASAAAAVAAPLLPRKASYTRCMSHAGDELRSFRSCLRWMCVDHSDRLRAAGSWALFVLLAVALPAAVHLGPLGAARAYDAQVQVSLTLAAALAYVSLSALVGGGLRRLLYLDRLRHDSEEVRAGYAEQLSRSFHLLACFSLPCFLADAAYKAHWYWAHRPLAGAPWAAAGACALEMASWMYRTALFVMVCVLFRIICYLQILRMRGFAEEFGKFTDVAVVLEQHRRIRGQLRRISHRYRKFILSGLVLVTASQFAALLATTRPHAQVNVATAGELALCSISLMTGLLICLHSAAKITHKTQAITSVAAAWHADATIHDQENPCPDAPAGAGTDAYLVSTSGDDSDSDPDSDSDSDESKSGDYLDNRSAQINTISYQKRQALVTYLENNRAGITVFGFVVDRTWLHALFMIEFSLVMWLLGKTVGIS